MGGCHLGYGWVLVGLIVGFFSFDDGGWQWLLLGVPRSNHKEKDKFKDNIIKQQFG